MKRILAAALAASAIAATAAPALAQYGPPPPPPPGGWHDDRGGWDHQGGDHQGPGGPGGPGGWDHRGGQPGGWDLDRRLDWMQQRIDHGAADGSLDRREVRRVRAALRSIVRDEHRARYRNGGDLNDRDRGFLSDRIDRLNDQIRWLRHNDQARPW